MSRCFGTKEQYEAETKKKEVVVPEKKRVVETKKKKVVVPEKTQYRGEEWKRQQNSNWDAEFITPEQYVMVKLQMLKNEMYIRVTDEEEAHLYSLKTEGDINRAVASIIDRAWG